MSNAGDETLEIIANITLKTNFIPPHSSAYIFRALEGSGGHTHPSNFFSHFKIRNALTHALVYEGVHNEDWISGSHLSGIAFDPPPSAKLHSIRHTQVYLLVVE